MNFEWIIIEAFAVLIENFSILFLVNSRLESKRESTVPLLFSLVIMSACGMIDVFIGLPNWTYEITIVIVVFLFLIIFKHGSIVAKSFAAILAFALTTCISILGAGIASLVLNVSIEHTKLYQDTSRLLAIVFIKSVQVTISYALAKKSFKRIKIRGFALVIFAMIITIAFVCMLFMLIRIDGYNDSFNRLLLLLAAGLLFIIVLVFVLLELFIREEDKHSTHISQLQRIKMEVTYMNEIEAIYADIRKWKHEFNNNHIALRALLESSEYNEAIAYMEKMSFNSDRIDNMLQTGSVILDALVSSKLWYASTMGIDVNVIAVYPIDSQVEDNDLCAIVGNLLDNAVEACLRISEEDSNRFISFSLLPKNRYLELSISNSFNGEIKMRGNRYLTVKNKSFHGIGMDLIDSIVSKYEGHITREHNDNVFETYVVIPLIPKGGGVK